MRSGVFSTGWPPGLPRFQPRGFECSLESRDLGRALSVSRSRNKEGNKYRKVCLPRQQPPTRNFEDQFGLGALGRGLVARSRRPRRELLVHLDLTMVPPPATCHLQQFVWGANENVNGSRYSEVRRTEHLTSIVGELCCHLRGCERRAGVLFVLALEAHKTFDSVQNDLGEGR